MGFGSSRHAKGADNLRQSGTFRGFCTVGGALLRLCPDACKTGNSVWSDLSVALSVLVAFAVLPDGIRPDRLPGNTAL